MSVLNAFTFRLQNMEPENADANVEHKPVLTSPTAVSDGNQDIPSPSPHPISLDPEPEADEQTPPTLLGKALQYVDEEGNNLLHITIRLDDSSMVHDVLAYGVDPFAKNKRGVSSFDMVFHVFDFNRRISMTVIRNLMWDHIKGN